MCLASQVDGCPSSSIYLLIPPQERLKYLYSINYKTHPRRGKIVQLLVGAPDGHAAFTTPLRLDASFAMAPRALRPDLGRTKSAPRF